MFKLNCLISISFQLNSNYFNTATNKIQYKGNTDLPVFQGGGRCFLFSFSAINLLMKIKPQIEKTREIFKNQKVYT